MPRPVDRRFRQARLPELFAAQHGVVSRPQLYGAGLTRSQVRGEVSGGRWQRLGRQTLALHTGPLDDTALMWRAVFETGADCALDGVSALLMHGLDNFETRVVHVSVSKGTRYRRPSGVRVHETRRRKETDVEVLGLRVVKPDVGVLGLRVVKPEVAAVRAALWAASDRQAAFLVVLPVQQGLITPSALADAFTSVRRDKRRSFLKRVIADVAEGVRSMGELDFARSCRRRGLPAPTRQAVRRTSDGRAYLDVYWDQFGVVVEIEGIHHVLPGIAVADSLRQNRLTIDNDRVLRIPVLGLRIAEAQFLDQVEELLRRHGWSGRPAAGAL